MFRRTLLIASTVASFLFAAAPALAKPVSIDFESFPGPDGVLGTADDLPSYDGSIIPLSNEFAAIGLNFDRGTLFKGDFYDGDPDNHFLSSSNPIGRFSVPVFGISIESYSHWTATLSAFDINGDLIDSFVLFHQNDGPFFDRGTLSLSTSQQIYSFRVDADTPDHILNLDNLVLNIPAPTAVPEPSQLLMFPLSLGLLALARKRRRAP
jgi:hypothetical protein